jgi:hypothetical protein
MLSDNGVRKPDNVVEISDYAVNKPDNAVRKLNNGVR